MGIGASMHWNAQDMWLSLRKKKAANSLLNSLQNPTLS